MKKCCDNECRQGKDCPQRTKVEAIDVALYVGAIVVTVAFAVLATTFWRMA